MALSRRPRWRGCSSRIRRRSPYRWFEGPLLCANPGEDTVAALYRPMLESVQQEGEKRVKDLVSEIAKALVDLPDEVTVREIAGEQVTVLELRVAPSDLGKVIGKQGRTARSIRTLLGAAGMKLNRRFTLEILE